MYILLGWRRIVVKEFQALPENFDIPSKKLELSLIKKKFKLRLLMKFLIWILSTQKIYTIQHFLE